MLAYLRTLLFVRPKKLRQRDVPSMSTEHLRTLYASAACRNDRQLLVSVWKELAERERDQRFLGEPTINVRADR